MTGRPVPDVGAVMQYLAAEANRHMTSYNGKCSRCGHKAPCRTYTYNAAAVAYVRDK